MRFGLVCTLTLFTSTALVACVADDGNGDSGSADTENDAETEDPDPDTAGEPACEPAGPIDAGFSIAIDGEDVGIGAQTFDLTVIDAEGVDPLGLDAIDGPFIDGPCTVTDGAPQGHVLLACTDAEGTAREVDIAVPSDMQLPSFAADEELELVYVIDTFASEVGPDLWSHAFVLLREDTLVLAGLTGRFTVGTDDDAFAALGLLESRVGWTSDDPACGPAYAGDECGLQALDVSVSLDGADATARSGSATALGDGELRIGVAEETVRDPSVENAGGNDCADYSLLGALLVSYE